jgi:hypothetical protein
MDRRVFLPMPVMHPMCLSYQKTASEELSEESTAPLAGSFSPENLIIKPFLPSKAHNLSVNQAAVPYRTYEFQLEREQRPPRQVLCSVRRQTSTVGEVWPHEA